MIRLRALFVCTMVPLSLLHESACMAACLTLPQGNRLCPSSCQDHPHMHLWV